MNPKVTALVLSFNRTHFIEKALESVGKQICADWELLLSDCSDDATSLAEIQRLFESFSEKYPNNKCRLLHHPKRMPQASHLEAALNACNTPYIALLDDDDYWHQEHLARATDWLDQDSKNGIVLSNGRVVDGTGVLTGYTNSKELPLPDETRPQDWLYYLLRSFYGSTSGFVFRREALNDWSYPEFPCIDLHIAVGILTNGYRCQGYAEPTYYYREHAESNYTKGEQVLHERHRWRLWLARKHGIKVTKKCPKFPLLVIKSAVSKK